MKTITSLTKSDPFRIDGSQTASSKELIADFFSAYDLHNVQNYMWEMFKQIYIGKHPKQPVADRQNLISFYENLHDFLTACYISKIQNEQEAAD